MLGQLADLPELFAALLTGVEFLLSEAHRLVVLPRLVSHQPALRGEGLVTALPTEEVRIAITISKPGLSPSHRS